VLFREDVGAKYNPTHKEVPRIPGQKATFEFLNIQKTAGVWPKLELKHVMAAAAAGSKDIQVFVWLQFEAHKMRNAEISRPITALDMSAFDVTPQADWKNFFIGAIDGSKTEKNMTQDIEAILGLAKNPGQARAARAMIEALEEGLGHKVGYKRLLDALLQGEEENEVLQGKYTQQILDATTVQQLTRVSVLVKRSATEDPKLRKMYAQAIRVKEDALFKAGRANSAPLDASTQAALQELYSELAKMEKGKEPAAAGEAALSRLDANRFSGNGTSTPTAAQKAASDRAAASTRSIRYSRWRRR